MAHVRTDDLVCPVCKEPLTLNAEKETLKCSKCRRAYPIRDEIPILLSDEAVIED
ncbi:MAG: Trm112 family protein [Terriglobales bacterium]